MDIETITLVAHMINKQLQFEAVNSDKTKCLTELANDFADFYEGTVELFNRDVFIEKCGIRV